MKNKKFQLLEDNGHKMSFKVLKLCLKLILSIDFCFNNLYEYEMRRKLYNIPHLNDIKQKEILL